MASAKLNAHQQTTVGYVLAAAFSGFFDAAADGVALVPVERISEWVGASLKDNYPEAGPAFLKFATTYWTLKILMRRVELAGSGCMARHIITRIDSLIHPLYFPFDGPYQIPVEQRERDIAMSLRAFGKRIDATDFLKRNPILIRQRRRDSKGGHGNPIGTHVGVHMRPRWTEGLPPHIRLSASQVERLDDIRTSFGVSIEEFHLHILSHPECTKMLQRHLYQSMQRSDPGHPDELYLVAIVTQRFLTAQLTGHDLFGIRNAVPEHASPDSPELVSAVVNVLRSRGLSTIERVAQAIVDEEAALTHVDASPGLAEANRQVALILAERASPT